MAIAAVDAEITGVQFVAVWNRLYRTVADIGILGREIVPHAPYEYDSQNNSPDTDHERKLVGPPGKNLRQLPGSLPLNPDAFAN
jgi:hypothetical protein